VLLGLALRFIESSSNVSNRSHPFFLKSPSLIFGFVGLMLSVSAFMNISLLPQKHVSEYLTLFTTVFGYGPSLPELAFDYWDQDILHESSRAIFNMISEAYPLGNNGFCFPALHVIDSFLQPDLHIRSTARWRFSSTYSVR
jgi:hypothetical protein